MTRKFLAAAAVAASIVAFPSVAGATTFTCKCASGFESTVKSGKLNKDGNNFTCDQVWTDNSTGHDTGGYNSNVKFSFPDAKVNGSSTNVKFAARNLPGECLLRATDAVNEHKEWEGVRCDDSNQDVNGFNFAVADADNHISTISGQLNTSNKANQFVAFYQDKTATEHHLVAVCAQDK